MKCVLCRSKLSFFNAAASTGGPFIEPVWVSLESQLHLGTRLILKTRIWCLLFTMFTVILGKSRVLAWSYWLWHWFWAFLLASLRYLHAVANPGLITFTGPYLDVGGAGYVVTISHTVHSSRWGALGQAGGLWITRAGWLCVLKIWKQKLVLKCWWWNVIWPCGNGALKHQEKSIL